MHILIVSQYFWPETFSINQLVSSLCDKGIRVTVLTGKPNYPEGKIYDNYCSLGIQKEKFGAVDVLRIPIFPRHNGSAYRLALNYASFVISGLIFGSFALRNVQFDAIFVYAPSPVLQALPAIWLSRTRRVPIILWIQDLWPESLEATGFIKNRLILSVIRLLVLFIYRNCNLLLVQSKAFIKPLIELGVNTSKIIYYPNSADVSWVNIQHSSVIVESYVSSMKKQFSVVFTGNVGKVQSIDTIIEAAELCAEDNEIVFYVIGNGSRFNWLQEQIRKRKLKNIIATGGLPASSMIAIWGAASVLLVTLSDNPTLNLTIPNKIQYYLAAGKPIIACLNGIGAETIIEANAGIRCQPDDPESLATAVRSIKMLSEENRQIIGENGKQYFNEHFSPLKSVMNLISIIKNLIAA